MARPEELRRIAGRITSRLMVAGQAGGAALGQRATTLDLVRAAGLRGSQHRVVTADGYLLTVHRVQSEQRPAARARPVVFLQHGLLCSSADWVIGDRSRAFAFLLADAGFDVWLGNFRGNVYSRQHVRLDPDTEEFWQFSWDQMGEFDLPAMLSFVSAATKVDRLVYVGHSMGTTAFWVMCNKERS